MKFKNIQANIIEVVEDKDLIEMMKQHTEAYEEVKDEAPKKKAKAKTEEAEEAPKEAKD